MSKPTGWRTGFLIGARGEVAFGSRRRPEATLRWRGSDGVERPARLLRYDPKLRLAVARGPIQARLLPLLPGDRGGLRPERWVVTIKYGRKGKAVPHAGVISKKRRSWGPIVGVPAQLGAPVLDLEGKLVGVVRGGGRRRATVVPIQRILPFFRDAVLGGDD